MTDEQKLLQYLGINREGINDFLVGSQERELEAEDDMHKLLVHLRIACDEVGYPFSEACYGSIQEFLEAQEEDFQ